MHAFPRLFRTLLRLGPIAFAIIALPISLRGQTARDRVPEPGPAPEIQLAQPDTFTLENGLKVFVVPDRKLPLVAFSLFVNYDPILESERAGYLEAFGELLRRGTTDLTKSEIDRAVDFIGADLYTSPRGIYAAALKKHTDTLLNLVEALVLNPDFQQEELDKIRTQALSSLQLDENDPSAIADRISDAFTFGLYHPYGEFASRDSWENITLEDARSFYRTYFRPNVSYLAMVGDLSVEEARQLARQYFGEWRADRVPEQRYDPPQPPLRPTIILVDRPSSVQSVIEISYPIRLAPGDSGQFPLMLANHILGGSFTSRLMQNLRETKGYTYGARSRVSADPVIGRVSMSTSVRNSVTDSAVSELLQELQRLRQIPVSEAELERAKASLIGDFIRELENPQTVAQLAIDRERYDLPADYYANYLKQIEAVTVDEVQKAAQRYLLPDNAYIIVVGKGDEIAEGLAPFGKLIYSDISGEVYDPRVNELPEGLTARKVIDTYLETMGGRDALTQLKSMSRTYTGDFQGQPIRITQQYRQPNMFLQRQEVGENYRVTEVYNGEVGRRVGQGENNRLAGEELERLQRNARPYPQLSYDTDGTTVALLRTDRVGDGMTYVLGVTAPGSPSRLEFYDAKTGLLRMVEETQTAPNGQAYTQLTRYEAYESFEGIQVPTEISVTTGGQTIQLEAESINMRPGLKKGDFTLD